MEVFPLAIRRICADHLYENFKKQFGSPTFYDLFWMAAKATSPYMYNKALGKMVNLNPASAVWLNKVEHRRSLHQFDAEVACHHNTSNFVESFNALIIEMRGLPLLDLMEGMIHFLRCVC